MNRQRRANVTRRPVGDARRSGAVVLAAASVFAALSLGSPSVGRAADPTPPRLEPSAAIAYWTADRIGAAVPRDLVLESGDPGRGPASEGTILAPAAAGDVTGANWTAAGAILVRSGLILFTLDGTDYAGWANEEGLTVAAVQHDFAVAIVGPGGKTGTQLDALGAYPVRIGGVDAGDRLHAFGYPAATPYDGDQLVYCLGSAGVGRLPAPGAPVTRRPA